MQQKVTVKNVKEYVKKVNIYIYIKSYKVTLNRNVNKEANKRNKKIYKNNKYIYIYINICIYIYIKITNIYIIHIIYIYIYIYIYINKNENIQIYRNVCRKIFM